MGWAIRGEDNDAETGWIFKKYLFYKEIADSTVFRGTGFAYYHRGGASRLVGAGHGRWNLAVGESIGPG